MTSISPPEGQDKTLVRVLYEALETLVGLFGKRSPLDSELLGEQREEIAAAIAALNQVRAIL